MLLAISPAASACSGPTGIGTVSWLAHDARLHYPAELPIYGDWIGWQPDVWWYED